MGSAFFRELRFFTESCETLHVPLHMVLQGYISMDEALLLGYILRHTEIADTWAKPEWEGWGALPTLTIQRRFGWGPTKAKTVVGALKTKGFIQTKIQPAPGFMEVKRGKPTRWVRIDAKSLAELGVED